MNIFTRKPKKPIITQPEPDEPFTSVEPATQVHHELLQMCSLCGEVGATHQFINGDLYLGRLPYNFLCDTCHAQREAKRTRHNVANKSTVLEHPAAPRKKRLVTIERTPSRPLEDRAVNLALEA
jgi:hypothetical protein